MPAIIPPAAAEQEHEPDDVVPYRCRGPCGQMVTHKPCTICAAIARARAGHREVPTWTREETTIDTTITSQNTTPLHKTP